MRAYITPGKVTALMTTLELKDSATNNVISMKVVFADTSHYKDITAIDTARKELHDYGTQLGYDMTHGNPNTVPSRNRKRYNGEVKKYKLALA